MGMHIGLKPDEVLDMSLEVFKACLRGYSDMLFDRQILGVQQGYWAGYYGRAKKPKSVKSILQKLMKIHKEKPVTKNTEKPEVDVDAFLAMEQQFNARRKNLNK